MAFFSIIRFSGITIRFHFPQQVTLPAAFTALSCADNLKPDEEFEICLLDRPLHPAQPPMIEDHGTHIYHTSEGCLRIYSPLTAEDGCQVACLLSPDGKHKLYYPASTWPRYAQELNCMHLIAGEALLLRHQAFLLHSSVVLYRGRTILFFGPSGAGKSTQARLWETYRGASVLNGDRCVIMKRGEIFYGGGSPWCGSSGIYHAGQAPIAGIFFVHQAAENAVTPLRASAFPLLFSQTTVNSWDNHFIETLTTLYSELLAQVPVYQLDCRIDEEAVLLVERTLFGKEPSL